MSTQKRFLISYLLVVLSLEKVIQHAVVSLSLLFDIGSVRSTVAVDYRALLVSGVVVAVLFAIAVWALARRKRFRV